MTINIDILLATYNGGNFLKEQIDSILSQSFQDFHLFIRDDGSTDNTLMIIHEAIKNNPSKITFLDDQRHLGAIKSFSHLLDISKAPYVMLSDQDDVWMVHKIENTFRKIRQMEDKFGKDKPLLVHSDLKVVDEHLQEISPSFWSYTHLKPKEGSHLNRLLVQNEITGCTVMMNRPLVSIGTPIFPNCVMHDWWLALVASAFGYIGVIYEPQILYRQHAKNTLGAKKFGISLLINKYKYEERKKTLKHLQQKRSQAIAFLEHYQTVLSPQKSQMIKDYISMEHIPILRNRMLFFKHRFFKHGLLRNLYSFFVLRCL